MSSIQDDVTRGSSADDAASADATAPVTTPHELDILVQMIKAGQLDVAHKIMLEIEPDELKALCATNRFFRQTCESNVFRDAYKKKWIVYVTVQQLMGPEYRFQLFKTRTVAHIRAQVNIRHLSPATDYSLYLLIASERSAKRNASVQSVLSGIPLETDSAGRDRLLIQMTILEGPLTYDRKIRHYFANGAFLDVSED